MSAPIDFDPNLVVVPGEVVPTPSTFALKQVGTYVQGIVMLPETTGAQTIAFLRLHRAPSAAGPWTTVDGIAPSEISVYNNLYDLDPPIGRETFYCATTVDALGVESPQSAPLSISALTS